MIKKKLKILSFFKGGDWIYMMHHDSWELYKDKKKLGIVN